jgi:hypothetical protein
MDPITLMAAASTAFSYLKKGIEVGKELSDMGSQLGAWANAISDLRLYGCTGTEPTVVEVHDRFSTGRCHRGIRR